MKRFLATLILNFFVMMNFCSAYSYDDDPNYYLVLDARRGYMVKTYLRLDSVKVQEYNPPHYQIAGEFIHVNPDGSKKDVYLVIRYNYNTKMTFARNDDYGDWKKFTDGTDKDGHTVSYELRAFANALFIAAYGMKFYE